MKIVDNVFRRKAKKNIGYTGLWSSGLNICLVVGRPGLDFLSESVQNTLNFSIHNFPAWRSA